MTDPGSLQGGSTSKATAINPAGQVVGWSDLSETWWPWHAVLRAKAVITDLGTLEGGNRSEATGIDPAGKIVGWSEARGHAVYAVLWRVK